MMIGRIVEIGSDDRYLACERGFLVVKCRGEEVGRTPLDDISALIANAHGLSYSNNLLVALAERGCPFVLCGPQHRPVGLLLPVVGHHVQAARMDAQLAASLPLRKQIWKVVVQRKLSMQGAVLEHLGRPSAPLHALSRKVRSGDPSNIEAQGARAYWKLLFDGPFKRDQEAPGANAMLNYGYAVLRAIVARQVMAAGLHPGIPIHHANDGNPMRLVDDLMEPFRPLVDLAVVRLLTDGVEDVDATAKKSLGSLHARTLILPPRSPVMAVVQRFVLSVVAAFMESKASALMELPREGDQIAEFFQETVAEEEATVEVSGD
jgi:CRISPR-associated protein Cas1